MALPGRVTSDSCEALAKWRQVNAAREWDALDGPQVYGLIELSKELAATPNEVRTDVQHVLVNWAVASELGNKSAPHISSRSAPGDCFSRSIADTTSPETPRVSPPYGVRIE